MLLLGGFSLLDIMKLPDYLLNCGSCYFAEVTKITIMLDQENTFQKFFYYFKEKNSKKTLINYRFKINANKH